MNINVILEKPITIEEAFNELKNGSLKVYNTNLEAELSWYPEDNVASMVSIFEVQGSVDVLEEIIGLTTFERFHSEFPVDGWYIGHIED